MERSAHTTDTARSHGTHAPWGTISGQIGACCHRQGCVFPLTYKFQPPSTWWF
jgi:hypothetical protein